VVRAQARIRPVCAGSGSNASRTLSRLHRGVAAGATGLALLLAGCGGGGGDEVVDEPVPAEPAPLTKQEFLFEADRICFAVESQIEAAADDYAGENPREADPRDVRRVVNDVVVPRLRSEVETIALLEPPEGDEDEVQRILEATERGADALEKDPAIVLDGIPPDLREAERLARAYGSKECGLR
jgi:hypothetical protein